MSSRDEFERKGDRGKGWFGRSGLDVAKAYVIPVRRRPMFWGGLLAGAVLIVVLAADFGFRDARWVSNGSLSSAHASLENDCASCHDPLSRQVTIEACSTCHERHGDELGIYTFASHYLYRSDDFQRVKVEEGEVPCFSCHPEHRGRKAQRTEVDDRLCISCHPDGSFSKGHPEFDVLSESIADPTGLNFSHVPHVREVMSKRSYSDIEKACLSCHKPDQDGEGFLAISFDRQCDACHLTSGVATARLPIADEGSLGVQTLEMIRSQGEPGTEWSQFVAPGEFREAGRRVLKTPLYHRDPWILHNLRRFRRELFEDGGIAELLDVSPDAPEGQLRQVYLEAIDTLEGFVTGLRGRPEPEIQHELEVISELLDGLRRSLNDPYTTLDETELLFSLQNLRPEVTPERIGEVTAVIDSLMAPCVTCHLVEGATVQRVQESQKTFVRAEFDHRSHILESRCLDCHSNIEIGEAIEDLSLPVPDNDLATTQNLPGIESCRTCHTPDLAASSCTTCHLFHPDLNRRSEFLLYVD